MSRTRTILAVLAVGGIAAAVALAPQRAAAQNAKVGVVSNIKVISDKVEDVTTPEDWKKTYVKEGATDKDKALAIWRTMVKYRHQTDPPNEDFYAGNVHDPFKTIHVYGYGMCCCAASNVEGLARYLGMEARGRIITQHSVPEIMVDGDWALIDCSLMNYFIKEDGKFASVDEIRDNVQAWRKANPEIAGNDNKLKEFSKNEGWKNGPPILARCEWYGKDGINAAGWHGWWSNIGEYNFKMDAKSHNVFDYGPSLGYRVNVQLRQGEKLTRNWFNKGLVVNGADASLIKGDRGVLGLQTKFGDVAPGRIGNGVLEYDAIADGALDKTALTYENVTRDGKALRAKDGGKAAELVIRMPSSYVYLTGALELTPVVGAGGSVVVSASVNNGLDWTELGKFEKSGDQKIDLKKIAFKHYDYRLKFAMSGAGTGLDAVKVTHDVQHSQAPLPALLEGDNKITFAAGAAEGTVTYEGNMSPSGNKGAQVSYTAYHPQLEGFEKPDEMRVGNSGTATALFTLNTPGDVARVRMNVHYRARDAKDGWEIQASFDGGKTFKSCEKLMGPYIGTSKYFTIPAEGAATKETQIKMIGTQKNTTCVFDMRIDADYKEPAGGFAPVKVTYVWEEGGQQKTDVHVCKTAQDAWTIKCGPKTVVKSYTVELAQ